MTLPLIQLHGSPYEQGRQHGEQLRERIAHNVDVYFNRFGEEAGLTRPEVLSRAAQYSARTGSRAYSRWGPDLCLRGDSASRETKAGGRAAGKKAAARGSPRTPARCPPA